MGKTPDPMRTLLLPILFVILGLFSSCFGGIDTSGSVLGYKKGVIRTEGGSFRVGALGNDWQRVSLKIRALVFKNSVTGDTITVDSWCKGAYDDGPLESLADQLVQGYQNVRVISSHIFKMQERDALRRRVQASLDGMPVFMDFAVLKMNACLFDFIHISNSGKNIPDADFENLIKGFVYLRGPSVL